MKEIWKDIKGYEGYYHVSNLGRVRSLDRYVATVGNSSGQRLIKGKLKEQNDWNAKNGGSYYAVILSKNNISVRYAVHRLVAEAFIPNPDNLPCINHKDENKHNNNVDNLEWCTVEYNNTYGTARERGSEKTKMAVLKFNLDGTLIKRYEGLGIASKEENVSKGNLENVCVHRNGKRTLNDFVFMYEDDYNENGFVGYKNTRVKAVNQYSLDGKFIRRLDSIKQATEVLPCISKNGQANITAVCRYRQKSAYGYIWRYADEVEITN